MFTVTYWVISHLHVPLGFHRPDPLPPCSLSPPSLDLGLFHGVRRSRDVILHVVCLVTIDIHYNFSRAPTRQTITQILPPSIGLLDCLWLSCSPTHKRHDKKIMRATVHLDKWLHERSLPEQRCIVGDLATSYELILQGMVTPTGAAVFKVTMGCSV